MKQHNRIFAQSGAKVMLAGLLTLGTATGQQALAEGVKIFTGPPPQAKELAAMMFPQQAEPEVRTRSIVFVNQNTAQPTSVKRPKQTKQAKRTKQAKPAKQAKRAKQTKQAKRAKPSKRSEGFGFLINFALNSSEIQSDSRPYLDQVGEMMKLPEAAKRKIVIEGHTDASGSAGYNKQLSIRRAQAVKDYLVKKHKVEPELLVAVGKGEAELLPDRSPRDGMNRRVQFHRANP